MVIQMNNSSIWLKGIKTKLLPQLKENITTDVLIIGGGITGITTAFYLKDTKLNIIIIDSNKIAHGTTAKTTGKLTYLQDSLLNKIKNNYGYNATTNYINSQKDAINLVKNNILEYNIKCNFESNSSYIFTDKEQDVSKIATTAKILSKAKIDYKLSKNIPIKYPCKYSLKVNDTAVFNPVKYILGLKEVLLKQKNIHIYEKTKAIDMYKDDEFYIVKTEKYAIRTKKVVLACHYPFFLTPGLFPFKTYLEKSFVTSGLIEKNKMFNAISIDGKHSIRYYSDSKDYIIYVGLSNTLKDNIDNGKKYNELLWHVKSHLTKDIKYYWFNYDVITPDGLPIIGYYEKNNPNLLIGTGFNTWGMTNGTIAGKILSDLIKKKDNKYSYLFDPRRCTTPTKIINTIGYNFENGMSFVCGKFKNNYKFYPKNVKVEMRDGKKCGIYIDENNKEHIVSNICPHMKCNLIFNTTDKTWDCPCHGSRFDIDGKAIKGPSVYNISIK